MAILYQTTNFIWDCPDDQVAQISGNIEWAYAWMEDCYNWLVSCFGFDYTVFRNGKHPIPTHVYVGTPGYVEGLGMTSEGELWFGQNPWNDNLVVRLVMAHELANLFTGEGVTGCWPTSWWADTRSPFPAMVAIQILISSGYPTSGLEPVGDNLYDMFKYLYQTYGCQMFRNAFQYMRQEGIDLCTISEPEKSRLVRDYLSRGAGVDLTPVYRQYGLIPGPSAAAGILGLGSLGVLAYVYATRFV